VASWTRSPWPWSPSGSSSPSAHRGGCRAGATHRERRSRFDDDIRAGERLAMRIWHKLRPEPDTRPDSPDHRTRNRDREEWARSACTKGRGRMKSISQGGRGTAHAGEVKEVAPALPATSCSLRTGGARRRQDGGADPPARGGDSPPRREGAAGRARVSAGCASSPSPSTQDRRGGTAVRLGDQRRHRSAAQARGRLEIDKRKIAVEPRSSPWAPRGGDRAPP